MQIIFYNVIDKVENLIGFIKANIWKSNLGNLLRPCKGRNYNCSNFF